MITNSTTIYYHPTSYSARYTFSGKERDEETGYSYFGARYYYSSYSIWLSVDPMSDKYPSLSPYVYCGNNPIKLVDPSGEDVYEMDQDGKITKKESSNRHILYAVDENGKRTSSISLKSDNLLEQLSNKRKDYDGHYAVGDKGDAFKVFKFGADNCNVEWAVAGYRTEGGGKEYVVGTSDSKRDALYRGAFSPFHNSSNFDKYNLLFEIHSHFGPGATQGASYGYSKSDMGSIRYTYNDYLNKGLPTQAGKGFPRYYVYAANTHKLFNFTPWKSSVFIRNINTSGDLYRNLSF